MSLCRHPHIATFYTSFISGKDVWLVTPIYEAGSAADLLQLKFPTGITEQPVLIFILKCVLEALKYLHKQGQIHRNVKASNILLDLKGNVYLSDFGVSAILREKPLAKTFTGTPCWMAPEILIEEQGYNYKADIWSLGITAIELAEGAAPYSELTSMKIIKTIISSDPPRLKEESKFDGRFVSFIYDCLQKNPALRSSVPELLDKYSDLFKTACDESLIKSLVVKIPCLEDRVLYITYYRFLLHF
jgi:serine/threonine-protein kinase OSR1/STK39